MVILNGSTNSPHHRQNRRRERPGSRTRRTINHKSNIRYECSEGILEAYDPTISLPSYRSNPSPLLRHNFDQSWQRWKEREAEEKAMAELERIQHEREQQRLFGGDLDDDVSLCEPMLGVLMSLFGDIDYTDP